ncbi:MAG: DinB family protein [Gemmatimonadota bacterium]
MLTALVRLADETPRLFESLRSAAERATSYAPGKWTLKEILGHLVDDERIFSYRLLCVARGEQNELPGFDEEIYATSGAFEQRTLANLLSEYAAVRAATLALLEHLTGAAWTRRGRVNGYTASARGLAFHIAGHELHHHRVIRERYVPLLEADLESVRPGNE